MSRKAWNVVPYDKNKALKLAKECSADDFAVLLLLSRGYDTPEKINGFFNSANEELSSPFLLKDMDKAVERIRRATENGERILVYGDYDADGVTATALLFSYLEATGAVVDHYIPSRIDEGYGLSENSAKHIAEGGFSLVITVDNGIAAFAEAEYFAENGIDLIITDHHKADSVLPKACAVVNPHRIDDSSPFKDLAGVGVAMKLVAALEDGDYTTVLQDFGDLTALGTVADIVPLYGENRTIVANGLPCIENTDRPGLQALIEAAGLGGKSISSSGVAFGLAPRINAAGRIESADIALELLLTEDEDEAQTLVESINAANARRQSVENEIMEKVEREFDKNPSLRLSRILVASGKDFHPGVIGIAASRLVERYGKPAVVISETENGDCKGSCRSIEGFSLYDALKSVSHTLVQFGGHTLAAGFSVKKEKINEFCAAINTYAASLPPVLPSLNIDCRLNPANITPDILDSLASLEPFGAANPSPVFGLFNMTVSSIKAIGNNKHTRVALTRQGCTVNAVWFGVTAEDFPFKVGEELDAAVKIERNDYNGKVNVSIQIKDVRPAGSDDEKMFLSLYSYESVIRGEKLTEELKASVCPDRTLFKKVYTYIKDNPGTNTAPELICFRTGVPSQYAGAVRVCIDAMCSLGLVYLEQDLFYPAKVDKKVDLSSNPLLVSLGYKQS